MLLAVLQLGAGDEAPQALQITGHATTVEAIDLDLNHLAVLFLLAQLVPALAQGQGPGADGDHAVGVLFPGYQNLDRQTCREAFFEVGNNSKATFLFGHEPGRLAADVHVDPVTFNADDLALHHIAGGAYGFVLFEGGQESFLIKVKVIHGAGWGFDHLFDHRGARARRGGLAATLTGRAEQVGHGQPIQFVRREQIVITPGGAAGCLRRRPGGGHQWHRLGSRPRLWRAGFLARDGGDFLALQHHHLGGAARRRGVGSRGGLGGNPGLTRRRLASSGHGLRGAW